MNMDTLDSITIEQLENELYRRKSKLPYAKPLRDINWKVIKEMAVKRRDAVAEKGTKSSVDNFEKLIFHEVMMQVFGSDYFVWESTVKR
jgi:uncharacterized protein YcgI (DUF1989 family)